MHHISSLNWTLAEGPCEWEGPKGYDIRASFRSSCHLTDRPYLLADRLSVDFYYCLCAVNLCEAYLMFVCCLTEASDREDLCCSKIFWISSLVLWWLSKRQPNVCKHVGLNRKTFFTCLKRSLDSSCLSVKGVIYFQFSSLSFSS